MVYTRSTPDNSAVSALIAGGSCRVRAHGEAPLKITAGSYLVRVAVGERTDSASALLTIYDSGDVGNAVGVRLLTGTAGITDDGQSITATALDAWSSDGNQEYAFEVALPEPTGEWVLSLRTDESSAAVPMDFSGFHVEDTLQRGTAQVGAGDIADGAVTLDALASEVTDLLGGASDVPVLTRRSGAMWPLHSYIGSSSLTHGAVSGGALVLRPTVLPATVTPAELGISITVGAASATARIIIYDDDGGFPGSPFWISAEIDCSVATNKLGTTTTMPTLIGGTTYWAGLVVSGSGVSVRMAPTPVAPLVEINPVLNTNTVPVVGFSATSVTPATPPDPWTSTTRVTAAVPFIYLVYP